MASSRRNVLVGVTLLVAAITGFVLSSVLGTIALAIAASYVLLPAHKWLSRHGVPSYWSAIAVTVAGVVASLLLVLPFIFVLYARRRSLLGLIDALDTTIPVSVGETTYLVSLSPLREALTPNVSKLAVTIGQSLSVLSAEFVVYAFVVFAALYYHDRIRSLVFGPVPPRYHFIVDEVHTRIREVIFGHYVLVIVGGVVTYFTGLGVFVLLGYDLPFILALVGAVLWVLPFVSAAPLAAALAIVHLLDGELIMAVLVAALGSVFLVAIPNLVVDAVRFRFGDPERLSQTLYFVGFVGGGLTIGVVGFVIGPLVLTILVTLVGLLARASTTGPVEQPA